MRWGTFVSFFGVSVISLSVVTAVRADGLIRSIWACSVPCHTKTDNQVAGFVQVAYCSTTTLSKAMIETLTPACQAKTNRPDVVAVRSSPAQVANCVSSSNPCPKEGLVKAGFTCHYRCPSEDKVIRKFTACAATDDEAWAFATQICKDAVAPSDSFLARSHVCTAEGQTTCE